MTALVDRLYAFLLRNHGVAYHTDIVNYVYSCYRPARNELYRSLLLIADPVQTVYGTQYRLKGNPQEATM